MSKRPGPTQADITIGMQLKVIRKLAGISMTQLGEEAGLSYQQIQKYEKGINRISANRLKQFADILDVPINLFFQYSDEQIMRIGDKTNHNIQKLWEDIPENNIKFNLLALIESIETLRKQNKFSQTQK